MDLPAKAQEIHRRLCRLYGCPIAYFHALDPLSELVSSLLSHRTRNADSGAAFKALRARYPDWHALLDAPVADIQHAIARVTWPEQKAPRIQSILRAILAERGALSLDFLADLPVDEARAWLQRLPGVGPKTSAAVLSFSLLRRAALAGGQPPSPRRATHRADPRHHGRRPVPRRPGRATAAGLGRAARL